MHSTSAASIGVRQEVLTSSSIPYETYLKKEKKRGGRKKGKENDKILAHISAHTRANRVPHILVSLQYVY